MKRIIRFTGIAAVVFAAVIAVLAIFVNANEFRPTLAAALSNALGRPVQIGDLRLALLSGGVTAGDLTVADDPAFSRTPFLQAKTLAVRVELLPLLFSHQVNVTGINIDQPRIILLKSPDGKWNFSSLGRDRAITTSAPQSDGGKRKFAFSVKDIRITGGTLTIGGTGVNTRPEIYSGVQVEARHFSPTTAFPFSLSANIAGGGNAQLSGTAGPLDPADSARTPFTASIRVRHLDLLAAGVVKASSGLAGLVTLDGTGSSDGRALHLEGRVRGDHMKFARNGSPAVKPVQFDFAADHSLASGSGALRRGDIHIGAAVARLNGRWAARGDSRSLTMELAGRDMPISELEAILPALGIVLPMGSSLQGGTAEAAMSITGPTDALVTAGTVGVRHTRLSGYDLGSRVRGIARIAGIKALPNTDIESFTASVRITPEGTTVDNLMLVAPSLGDLSGNGTVSPTHALAFRMLARLHTSGLLTLAQRGDLGVPFVVTGTSSSPVFAPDVKGIAASEAKSLLNNKQVSDGAQKLIQGLFGRKPRP